MIGFVEGTVTAQYPTGAVIRTEGGVGYLVRTTTPAAVGDTVAVHVHTIVREDAITLYGFSDPATVILFTTLCKAPRVGPATAFAVIRDLGGPAVVNAIRADQPKVLTAATGVGAAAAKAFCDLTLPDSVDDVFGTDGPGPSARSAESEVVDALVNLGYDVTAAANAAASARKTLGADAADDAVVVHAIRAIATA